MTGLENVGIQVGIQSFRHNFGIDRHIRDLDHGIRNFHHNYCIEDFDIEGLGIPGFDTQGCCRNVLK